MGAKLRTFLLILCAALPAWRAAAQDFDPKMAATAQGQVVYQGHCSQCHDTGAVHAPSRQSLQLVSPETVFGALSAGGVMAGPGSSLTDDQKRTEYDKAHPRA